MAYSLPALANGSSVPDYRISDARVYFELFSSQLDERLSIREPIGWSSAEWTMERDKTWHGVNFEFSGEEATLKFREEKAVAYIERVYKGFGPNGQIELQWGLQDETGDLPMQRLKLNLSKRNLKGGELTVPGERVSLHPDIRARWDTTVSLNANQAIATDVFGSPVAIVPPDPVLLTLHAQRIKQSTVVKPDTDKHDTDWKSFQNSGASVLQGGNPLTGLTGTKVYREFYVSFPFSEEKAAPKEVESFVGSTTGVDILDPLPILTTKAEGEYQIDVSVDMTVDARLQKAGVSLDPPDILSFTLRILLIAAGTTHNIAVPVTGRPRSRFMGAKRIAGTLSVKLTLPVGAAVSCFGLLQIQPDRSNWRGTDVRAVVTSASLSIVANTSAPASTAPAYPVLDVLTHLTAALSGRPAAVQSTYYSRKSSTQPVDGGGSHRLLTSGFLLRNFLSKPAQTSLQDVLTSLQAIDAVGMSYRPTATGDVLVVEPIANFYRDAEILRLDSYTVIDEQTATEYLHPNISIGYEKYPDDGPQFLDEFNTRQEYVMPGKAGTPYQQISSLIASGYALEKTRRAQFSKTPTDSTTYDDDLFIICVEPTGPQTATGTRVSVAARLGTHGKKAALFIKPGLVPAWLAKGVTLQISGSSVPANNGLYRIGEVELTFQPKPVINGPRRLLSIETAMAFTLDRPVTAETGTLILSIGKGGTYRAERADSFALVTGVVDPQTTYNLRLSPRFNLLRHGRYVAGSLVYTNGAEPITCQFAKQNGSLKTRLKDSAEGDLNIDIRRPIGHTDTVYVADLREPLDPIWSPETITVETRLTLDQMLYLRACLQGYHPNNALHYGYLTLVRADGSELPVFPLKLSYQPALNKCVLTGLKKFVPLSQPTGQRGCLFYRQYTFADFESSQTGTVDAWIEDCRFDNFG